MAERTYGQYCGLARALDLVGERWALLLIRDLLVSPKRFTDLRRGLPRIPSNILSTRLRELEEAGVVQRRVLARPETGVVYELTHYGEELEEVVLRLGTWGAARLGEPRPGEVLTPDSMVIALRAMFHPAAAAGVHVSFQFELGPVVFHARVDDGVLADGAGPMPEPDLVISGGPGVRAMFTGEVDAADSVATGLVRLSGPAPDPLALLQTFTEMFRLEVPVDVPVAVA
ncbi:helix-turn-helix domain-containing protein [Sporichthya sp.]|uniref:winged helix-turn-helix transcriptional regulator n=1 Tax=Sporichthya sp. TaxID=65475 RepID=UPI0018591F72|nr:helix-turn-helix domain-containing protein [Sporichthya sp.]MBA3743643.1 helix-turn-helix transcriptional regulator [Sporichthya sp.]